MLNDLFLNFGFMKSMFNLVFFSENLGRKAIRAPATNKIKHYNTCDHYVCVCKKACNNSQFQKVIKWALYNAYMHLYKTSTEYSLRYKLSFIILKTSSCLCL